MFVKLPQKAMITADRVQQLKEVVMDIWAKKKWSYVNAYYISQVLMHNGFYCNVTQAGVVLESLRIDGVLDCTLTVKSKYHASRRWKYRNKYYRLARR